jgi:predicted nucleic acid-binding protein
VIVVADTSVILNLCFLGQESLLATLFGTMHAPPQVEAEFLLRAAGEVA